MKGEQIFEKISELKEKFKDFFQQRKQLTALENHSHVKKFTQAEQEVFEVIKYCMKGSFLEDEDAEWVTKKISRLHINYLDWAHRTKWLKQQIESSKGLKKTQAIQTFFEFAPASSPMYISPEVLKMQINPQHQARV